ncbi:MAG: AlpA family phage regulatory protein [Phenylobacterium sp.]|uniref:helix-turn-helix transcriptional regulator n=1 Tax=Phenylobacterium sp. TaxID=1871053 RepID=UPI0012222981|nr:AlpA family phage regulatory protein [Phenylobacterium sp.]TAJ70145.1 MAG: AlpA family phage regulatory protein [Phenylobacterium sp.]
MTHWRDFLDADAPGGDYLPWSVVKRRTSLSRTTAWRLQKRGEFPEPYNISPGRVGYREDEVKAWQIS